MVVRDAARFLVNVPHLLVSNSVELLNPLSKRRGESLGIVLGRSSEHCLRQKRSTNLPCRFGNAFLLIKRLCAIGRIAHGLGDFS